MQLKPDLTTDLQTVLDNEIKEWHFHIYFLQNNASEHAAALALRDAVLSLRKNGAFVAVPLWRVNMGPKGPHPAGSYEVWCPAEYFSSVFSYLCQHRGALSILVHPLTSEERRDHDTRKAWMGQSWPIDLSTLRVKFPTPQLQYPTLKLGYSSKAPKISLEARRKMGAEIEEKLKGEGCAAGVPV